MVLPSNQKHGSGCCEHNGLLPVGGAEQVSIFDGALMGSCRPDNDVKLDQTIKAKQLAQVVMFASRPVIATRSLAMAA